MKNLIKSFKNSPRYSIKWSNYYEIYENIFQKFVNKKIKNVEIGIGDGGSLFMWRKFFGKKAKIIGIELNPEAKKLEKYGFKIFNGDQSNPNFWKNFYKKIGKIDILIDDGGHTNLQQITTLMESLKNIKDGGMIVVEDTHTSFMKNSGFRNPSKYSFINFSRALIENIHRRNPMLKKEMNFFSEKIYSLSFYDSIIVVNITKKKLSPSKNLKNNKKLINLFDDYRFKKAKNHKDLIENNFLLSLIKNKLSKRSFLYRIYENSLIKRYLRKIKE
jgi:hypothetical protein